MDFEEREELLPADPPSETNDLTPAASPEADNNEDSWASTKIADDDEVIEEEEAGERLISGDHGQQGLSGLLRMPWRREKDSEHTGRSKRQKRNRPARRTTMRRVRHEEPEIMYEMEEGDRWASSESSRDSSEADRERLSHLRGRKLVCIKASGDGTDLGLIVCSLEDRKYVDSPLSTSSLFWSFLHCYLPPTKLRTNVIQLT